MTGRSTEKELSMKIVATLIAIALVSAASLVMAADPAQAPARGGGAEKMRAADTNGDGLISRQEADASLPRVAKHFEEIDANKDGQLSREEMRAFHDARKAKHKAGEVAPTPK
jgi:EF hand